MRSSEVWDASKALPMSGSATLATERLRLATPATRISATSTSPPRSGARPLSVSTSIRTPLSSRDRPFELHRFRGRRCWPHHQDARDEEADAAERRAEVDPLDADRLAGVGQHECRDRGNAEGDRPGHVEAGDPPIVTTGVRDPQRDDGDGARDEERRGAVEVG